MYAMTKLALSVICTFVASNVFAQCPVGSPCAQRNAGYYNENSPAYENNNAPSRRQDNYRGGYQNSPQQYSYSSEPSFYQSSEDGQLADDSPMPPSSVTERPMMPSGGQPTRR